MKYPNEFYQVFNHELGHIIDLGSLNGKSKVRSSLFTEFGQKNFAIDDPSIPFYSISWQSEEIRKEAATQEDFCSGYGMTDPFEDFAECHNLYLNHQNIFKTLAASNSALEQKYAYFDALYQKHYFSDSELSLLEREAGWRPWDTTRITE